MIILWTLSGIFIRACARKFVNSPNIWEEFPFQSSELSGLKRSEGNMGRIFLGNPSRNSGKGTKKYGYLFVICG